MIRKCLPGAAVLIGLLLFGFAYFASAQSAPQEINDSQLNPRSTTIGGASPLRTTRTVQHWFGQTLNPQNGVTYGTNMVGADPNNCTGQACSATITADITPLNVVVDGRMFSGQDVLEPTLVSPVFGPNDYGSTPFATVLGAFPNTPRLIKGPGGTLSQGDVGEQLQLQDAIMRAQFNKTGSSTFHLKLNPVTHDAITIVVPAGKATLLRTARGVVFADINIQWWSTRIQNLISSLGYVDPTHLPIFLTNDVVNFIGTNPLNCCVIGFHGAGPVPSHVKGENGPVNGNGNQPVQTFAWASWTSPGFFARPNGGTDWALQDIHALSHEISEWADDPFIDNFVEPWTSPVISGCSNILETGDPVVAIGFAIGTNTFEQGLNPDGITQSADGFYHPEDEVHLPWFMRLAPNLVSEPTQTSSTNIGRYTFMGTLNPFEAFTRPATCP